MADHDFIYDVAFSFHSLDEAQAVQLNSLISERFRTFLYTEQQAKLAGSDGELTFNKVFGAEARVVIVLFREEWGTTPFTRIEQTAIRNRAFESGYDFTLFIPTVAGAKLPTWLPRPSIYYDNNRFGPNGLQAVIEHKLQSAGAEPHADDAASRATRMMVAEKLMEARRLFSYEQGVVAANQDVPALRARMQEMIEDLNAADGSLQLRYREHRNIAVVSRGWLNMIVNWQQHYGNSLEGATLEEDLWRGLPSGVLPGAYTRENNRITSAKYRYDLADHGRPAFIRYERIFQPRDLADHLLAGFFTASTRHAKG